MVNAIFQTFAFGMIPTYGLDTHTFCVPDCVASQFGIGNKPGFAEFFIVVRIFFPGFFYVLEPRVNVKRGFDV